MRVLVFGAGGYLGSVIARVLRRHGHAVAALARDDASAVQFRARGIDPVRGDLSDMDALCGFVRDADGVVFASHIPLDQEWPVASAIIKAQEGSGKAFILTSGTAILSHETPDGEWCEETYTEDDPFTPRDWNVARLATELYVRAACERGVRTIVVRPPLIWGLGGSRQIPALFESVQKTGSACYIGAGLNLYSHVHVEDLAEIYAASLVNGQAGALYHAVAGEANWRSIAEAVGEVTGSPTRSVTIQEAEEIWGPLMGPRYFGLSSRSRAPRARRELSWSPRHLDVLDDIRNGSYRDRYRAEGLSSFATGMFAASAYG